MFSTKVFTEVKFENKQVNENSFAMPGWPMTDKLTE